MDASPHIRLLPIHVANKIAAGEVVDRPASVVKELVENALDSGATQLDLQVTVGGRKLISVTDNGCGMGRDDALLSIERQATSKIRDVDDIEHIDTLGFRGEALAAIASVSRFRLQTCARGEVAGTELLISGGKIRDVREVGCPPGTCVEVRDLFFNVPARRKFLRSQQTELSHVRSGFIIQALARPSVGMSLKVDGRRVYELAAGASLEDRLRDLFGVRYLEGLRHVDYRGREVRIQGYVSLPSITRSDRNEQHVFVNGRATSAPVAGYAIREGYHSLVPNGRHPSVFLFIETDPGLVDVNVHPTKKEVRFRHPGEVRDSLIAGIRDALHPDGAPPAAAGMPPADAQRETPAVAVDAQLHIDDLPAARAFRYPRMPIAERSPWSGPDAEPHDGADGSDRPERTLGAEAGADDANAPGGSPWTWCRVVGQVGSLYVVLETDDGFVLMDPHAAHERVLFERYMTAVRNGQVSCQSLLLPETVELQPSDSARVRKHLDLFAELGFGISEFGGDAFVIDAVPSTFAGASGQSLLAEISLSLEQAGARGTKGRWQEEAIAQAACKTAVKARDRLLLEEIEELVVELAKSQMPYTCPHGRPTLIYTSFRELNRKFGRE